MYIAFKIRIKTGEKSKCEIGRRYKENENERKREGEKKKYWWCVREGKREIEKV